MKRLTITLSKKQRKFLKDISKAAKRFFKKALAVCHSTTPRVVTVDENPAYPLAIEQFKEEKLMPEGVKIRRIRYPNNIVEIIVSLRNVCVLCWDLSCMKQPLLY
jgi:transposase-like protein